MQDGQDNVHLVGGEGQANQVHKSRANGTPVVAGHELASAVIQDTVNYLGIQATGVSRLNGPYLQVRNVGPDASDILLVGSFRAHYKPGGNGSGPILNGLPPAIMKQNGTPAADTPAPALLTRAGSLAATSSGGMATGSAPAPEQSQERGDEFAYSVTNGELMRYEQQQAPQQSWQQVEELGCGKGYEGSAGAGAAHMYESMEPRGRAGPIIEECPSDTEPSSAGGPRRRQHHHYHARPHDHLQKAQGDLAASAHALPRSVPIVQLAESLSDPDRVMEDVSTEEQQGQERVLAAAVQDAQQAPGVGVGGLANGPAHAGHLVQLAGPGLGAASAFASAVAAEAAAAGGVAMTPAALPPAAGPLLLSPRPRSEWELDPSKIVLGRRLAVGGFGEVFVAKYEGTLVAVKRLLASDSGTTQRFIDEVHMLARLRHPNLLLFMGYTLTPEPSIVTEFMARGSLFHILRQAGNRPPEPRIQRAVAVAVARGMAYLHSRQPPILHLDLKSPNVLVDDRWRVKIADFGLSRVRQRTYVSSGAAAGSPEWMAPEVLRCDHYAEAADVYSFGVVLWELLTGEAPWADLNAMQVVGAVGFARRSLPDPTGGDELLLHLCKACRAHDPTQRPSFSQIVEAMDSHFGPSPWPAPGVGPTPGNNHALPVAGAAGAGVGACMVNLPALPPPEGTQGKDAAAATGGEAAAARAPADAAAPLRLTRRHSLASGPDPEMASGAGPAEAAGSGGGPVPSSLSASGGVPPRLDARFVSAHESPRSRRRYRSPRSEDMVMGPPAITARLQDGRKTPSPRTASGRAWRIGTFDSCEEYEVGPQPGKKGPEQPSAAASGGRDAGVSASAGAVAGRLLPARASPFADLATANFGPGSVADVRALQPDRTGEAAGGDAGVGCDHVQSMELGSPVGSVQQAAAPVLPCHVGRAEDGAAAGPCSGDQGAGPAPQPHPSLQPPPQQQSGAELALPQQELSQHQRQLGQAPAQAAPQLQEAATAAEQPPQEQAPAPVQQAADAPSAPHPHHLGRISSRPGHRRVASDEAGHLRLQAAMAAAAAAADPGSGATGVPGSAAGSLLPGAVAAQQPQQLQQHRLAAAAGPGAPPPSARRSRGLARNSAPMRYTYGGAPQPQLPHQLQPPSRPRTYHAHHLAQVLQQQQQQQQPQPLGMRLQQYQYYQHHLSGGPGGEPSTPGAGGAAGAAALAAPVSLSPLHPDPVVAGHGLEESGQRLDAVMGVAGGGVPGVGGGADPWADTQSELSFAFILNDENASICSDDYPQSTSLDRMPLLEADEVAEASAVDFVESMEAAADQQRQAGNGNGAIEVLDTSFDLPRPFRGLEQPFGPQASPFQAMAAAGLAQAGDAAAGDDGEQGMPAADLWAALQQHSLGHHSPRQHLSTAAWLQEPRHAEESAGAAQAERGPQGPARQQDQNKPLVHSQDVDCNTILQPQQQLTQTLPEPAAAPLSHASSGGGGGGVTTYRSGRFKVTIEPAASDAQPQVPPPAPSQHQEQNQQQTQRQSLIDTVEQQHQNSNPTLHAPPPPAAQGASADVGTALPPAAAPAPATACTVAMDSGPVSPCGSVGAQLLGSSPGGPSTCARTRVSHHGACHGELSGCPPVALNSVTMYRKGRFFVSHAAAGTHSLTVTNPFASAATSSLAAGGGSSAESPHNESEEHDGASGPSSPLGNGGGAAAAAAIECGLPSRQSSGGCSPPGANRPMSWAAVAAMPPPPKPGGAVAIAASGRQYSCGRFTVAESIVAAPVVEQRRPSCDSSAAGELPRTGSADHANATAAAAARAPCAGHGHGLLPPATQSAAVVLAAAAVANGPQPQHMHHVQSAPCMGVAPEPQAQAAAHGAAARQACCPPGHAGAATAPASPRVENVVVRKVGRFTVREVEAGSNASSRGPSSSGAHMEASREVPPATTAGMLLSAGVLGRGGQSVQGSPPEDAHLLGSHHSSCSFASASGDCSRSSSQGIEMEMGAQPCPGQRHEQQEPPPAPPPQQQQQRGAVQVAAAGAQAAPSEGAPVAAAAEAPPKVLRIRSKGRFTVFEHEAPDAVATLGADVQPVLAPASEPSSHPPAPAPAPGDAAAGAGPAAAGAFAAQAADHEMAAVPPAGAPPHGGVLHPPPLPPRAPPGPPAGGFAAQHVAAAAAAAAAPWGQSGPQAPELAAQLQADMARMVRERMARNERDRRQQEQQQGQQLGQRPPEGGRERLGGGEAGGADGERCTYEVTIGRGLTIQISHELQGGGPDEMGGAEDGVEGEEGEGEQEDAVMVDVGIVHGEAEDGGSDSESDSDSDREDREQQQGGEGGGPEEWEHQSLQPPGTPTHEAVQGRSWLLGGGVGMEWRRRRVSGGDGVGDDEDSSGGEDESMES